MCCLLLSPLDTPVSATDVDLDGKLHTHSLPIICEVNFISAQANYLSNSHPHTPLCHVYWEMDRGGPEGVVVSWSPS